MEQIQVPVSVPHLVQVFQPSTTTEDLHTPQIFHITHPSLQTQGKITYEQTITSESLHMTERQHIQSQIVMCQQTHMQTIQQSLPNVQSHILQSSDLNQPLQFTSHIILPQVPVYKQIVVDDQHYYGQYEYQVKDKQSSIKVEANGAAGIKQECNSQENNNQKQIEIEIEVPPIKKRSRSHTPNPSEWACNVRKLKHQRGEAYINRRGKLVPEKHVKTTKDCLTSCKFKCSERINDTDREHIFKAFYSLNANEKKHFLLNTTERINVRSRSSDANHRRQYSFKYFFLVRANRYTVCKNFYLGTLAISQKPVYNVHQGKSEMNIPKPDGRGLSETSVHALPTEAKDRIRQHIMSFKLVDSKPVKQFSRKKQYLEAGLSIKQMYNMYAQDCNEKSIVPLKESMYRKIFKQEFNLHFRKRKQTNHQQTTDQQLCCKCKGPVKT